VFFHGHNKFVEVAPLVCINAGRSAEIRKGRKISCFEKYYAENNMLKNILL
jgi:hypothetical protein